MKRKRPILKNAASVRVPEPVQDDAPGWDGTTEPSDRICIPPSSLVPMGLDLGYDADHIMVNFAAHCCTWDFQRGKYC